jgi:hypothetical protein
LFLQRDNDAQDTRVDQKIYSRALIDAAPATNGSYSRASNSLGLTPKWEINDIVLLPFCVSLDPLRRATPQRYSKHLQVSARRVNSEFLGVADNGSIILEHRKIPSCHQVAYEATRSLLGLHR